PGQPFEPPARLADQLIPRLRIAGLQALDEALDPGCVEFGPAHGTTRCVQMVLAGSGATLAAALLYTPGRCRSSYHLAPFLGGPGGAAAVGERSGGRRAGRSRPG